MVARVLPSYLKLLPLRPGASLELFHNSKLKEFYEVANFKENDFTKYDVVNNEEEDDSRNMALEDVKLVEALKNLSYPDKQFKIVNKFFNFDNENLESYIEDEKVMQDLNKIILSNPEFVDQNLDPEEEDFEDKVQRILAESFGPPQEKKVMKQPPKKCMTHDVAKQKEEKKNFYENEFLLDICLKDKLNSVTLEDKNEFKEMAEEEITSSRSQGSSNCKTSDVWI